MVIDEIDIEKILKRFPYALAFPLKIVFAIDEKEEPWKKLDSVLYSAETIARFLGATAICETMRLFDNNIISDKPELFHNFTQKIEKISFGSWIEISRELFKFLKKYNEHIVLKDIITIYDNKIVKTAIDELNTMRNSFGHSIDRAKLPKETFYQISKIAYNFLTDIVSNLEILQNLSFSYISSIELHKGKRETPLFIYKGKRLDGMDFVKEAVVKLADEKFSYFKETNSVIIRYQEKDKYLNLFPFYIYDEINGKSADIFYYNGRKNNRYDYIACGYGGMIEIRKIAETPKKSSAVDWRDLVKGENVVSEQTNDIFSIIEDEFSYINSKFNNNKENI